MAIGRELYYTSLFNDANLLSYWRMEGNSNDSKGSNHGVDTDMAYTASVSKFGQCAEFNGTSSFISTTSSALGTGDFTVMLWFKGVATPTWRYLFETFITTGDGLIITTWSGVTRVSMGNWWTEAISGGSISDTDTDWHHIAVTRSGTTVTCYLDGVQSGTSGTSSADISGPNYIGKITNNADVSAYFPGRIDDVAIFNRALSVSEIENLIISPTSLNYILDGQYLPRPKGFSRSFASVYQDHQTISGKTVRDLDILDKEVYTLSWETLDSYEVALLLAIVEKNMAITFQISEDNLTINSKSVFAKIASISYSIVGSNYLASLQLRLEQVS